MVKTLQIEENTYNILSNLKVNNDTFDDVILRLVNFYNDGEEFSDEKAQYYK